jgi:hypothetical protein
VSQGKSAKFTEFAFIPKLGGFFLADYEQGDIESCPSGLQHDERPAPGCSALSRSVQALLRAGKFVRFFLATKSQVGGFALSRPSRRSMVDGARSGSGAMVALDARD